MTDCIKKKVLFIVFGFPPRAGSGIQRVVRFVQHLPENEWEPIILTIPKWGNDIVDTTWEKQLPADLKIYRVLSLDPFRIFQALRTKKADDDPRPTNNSNRSSGSNGALQAVRNLFHKISVPDQAVWWAPAALVYGIILIIRHRPKLIFSTSGPYGAALAGLLLAKLSGLKWVAEFRDPWAAHPLRERQGVLAALENSMERSCLRQASGIIATTIDTTNQYKLRTPPNGCSRFHTITNGFHPPDFQSIRPLVANEQLRIVYTGMFYGSHVPDYFFEGIKRACILCEEFKHNFRVVIAGSMPSSSRLKANEPPLNEIVKIKPYIAHDQVIQLLQSADMLYLALAAEQGSIIPGKLFEYLAAQRYIFATVPEGVTADIIDLFQAGIIAPPQDVDQISDNLLKVFRFHREGKLTTNHSLGDINEFSWDELTRRLAELFNDVIERKDL